MEAGTEDNVLGWAWSENIGWISFNCNNPELPSPRCTYNYGVNINSLTGILSGYAWSENIGWLTFNESELAGCPTSPCQAKLDVLTKQISGWSRALAYGGGWDGWIRLRDTSYGVLINDIVSPAEFRNWAWSDMNIGWVSFNRANCDPDKNGFSKGIGACPPAGTPISNYKVITSFSFNQPPVADFSCVPTNCTIYTGENLTLNDGSADIDNNITSLEWYIDSDPDFSCPSSGCGSPAGSCDCDNTVQSSILGTGDYQIKLTVKDAFNETDDLTRTLTIKQDAIADFKCSLDNSTWVICQNFKAKTGQTVYFLSQSSASEGASITSWSWVFQDATPPIANTSSPQTKFTKSGTKTVSLTIEDSAGRNASQTYNLKIQMPVPDWEEIAPF
ncbi:MAG: PKD domain-containing protein [bacterium]|nr:PKD domain-containing protein [bacterium]